VSVQRYRFGGHAAGNTSAELTSSSRVGDLETLKQELMADMRQELQKVKDEIVQGLMRNTSVKGISR